MSKIGLIIKREYSTRVRKKSFLVLTLIGPLLFAGLIFAPMIIANSSKTARRVVVVDATHSFCGIIPNTESANYDYGYCNFNIDQVRNIFMDSSDVSVLFIPTKVEQDNKVMLYSKTDPDMAVISGIELSMNGILEKSKMKAQNLDPTVIEAVKTSIDVQNTVNNKVTDSVYNFILGYASSFLIYMFIFLYSMQVMRGVMEEKISRIVEIIISSVKPFELMMGKVIGVCLVGLTQFLIWVIISVTVVSVGSGFIQKQQINPNNARVEQTMKQGATQQEKQIMQSIKNNSKSDAISKGASIIENLDRTNWPLVIGCFIFYFLCGYLLYSSLFAAIGSAVDAETETQQFILPVTAPLILSLIIMQSIIQDPQSSLAVWFSIIPFTSPIAMMARIPFGLPVWQLLLSMALLIITIFGTIWLASRIYRIGLLMYGKKVSYKELGKWLFYK
jgi:ABC-2 type transport system permease protein